MFLKLFRSVWVKFLLSCAIIYFMVEEMISGELTFFWFLIMTLSLAYLLMSQTNMVTSRWGSYVDDVRRDVEHEEEEEEKKKDDDDHQGPIGWA